MLTDISAAKNRPTLSIGVPTYNSYPYLVDTLRSIRRELGECPKDGVEVIILDNASTDETHRVYNEIQDEPRIAVLRNPINMGATYSIDALARRAQGEYLWLLGSQDYLLPGALNHLLYYLREFRPSLLVLSHHIYSEATDTLVIRGRKKDRVFARPWLFLAAGGPRLAMSATIAMASAYRTAMDRPLIASNWPAYERHLRCSINISRASPAIRVAKPCFMLVQEADGWWTTSAVLLNYIELVRAIRCILKPHPLLRNLLMRRLSGRSLVRSLKLGKGVGVRFNRELFCAVFRSFGSRPAFWIFGLPTFASLLLREWMADMMSSDTV